MYKKNKNQQNARVLQDFCPKNYQNTRIFMIFARKFYKIPEFHMIFARKMSEFYVIIARKIFFPNFRGAHKKKIAEKYFSAKCHIKSQNRPLVH